MLPAERDEHKKQDRLGEAGGHERVGEFTGEVKSWIDQIVVHNPTLPFANAKTEQRGARSQKRRDLTIVDRDGRAVITGEVKLPYAKDGTSPYRSEVVLDARKKAERANVQYFFTWNVNKPYLLLGHCKRRARPEGQRLSSLASRQYLQARTP